MTVLLTVIWSLYFWSETAQSGGDVGTFEATENANVFVIDSLVIEEQGLKFGVHNEGWAEQYGWSDEGGSVTSAGTAVKLALSSGATGWCALPVGAYDVTFDLSVPSIRFDKAEEEKEPEEPETVAFLRGGDVTMATYIEDMGAKFYYHDGTQGDVFDILQAYGVNLARLRLYNAPGTAVQNGSTTYCTPITTTKNPSGYPYAGPNDIYALAQRAKAHKMAICLSIYLSDFWSGATEQFIPAAWSTATTLEALGDSVTAYVTRVMTQMVAQGTAPEYVSVGNETNYGILYNKDKNTTYVNYGGHTTKNGWSKAVYLFNKAYDAIKAVSPTSQVIIHHSYGDQGKIATCRSFFQSFKSNGGKFDIVGGSYYPHWATDHGATDCTPTGMLEWAADMKTNIGKPVMIMEVGYSWDPYKCPDRNGGNWQGQLGLNGAYNEASEKGQADFMKALHEALKTDENILGYMYWDPIFVDQKVNGDWIKTCWAERYDSGYDTWWEDGNVISNTTLFDYAGKPLKALWSEVASQAGGATDLEAVGGETANAVRSEKIIKDGQLFILRDGRIYNAFGVRVK